MRKEWDFFRMYPDSFILRFDDEVKNVKQVFDMMGLSAPAEDGLECMTSKRMNILPEVVIHDKQIYERKILFDRKKMRQWEKDPDELWPVVNFANFREDFASE